MSIDLLPRTTYAQLSNVSDVAIQTQYDTLTSKFITQVVTRDGRVVDTLVGNNEIEAQDNHFWAFEEYTSGDPRRSYC